MPQAKTRTRLSRPATKKGLSKSEAEYLKRLRDNLPFYCEDQLKIVNKETALIPFRFNRAQQVAHKKITAQWREKGFVKAIVLKARQEGISTYVAGRYFRRVHLLPNHKTMIVAHEQVPASTLFEMYERYFNNVPEGMIEDRKYGTRGLQLVLENDSQITVRTANNVHGSRSSTVHLLHASEVAFWERADDTFTALAQTVPKRGSEIIMESTANGVGGFFHQRWEDAEQGKSDYIPIFLPWWIHEEYREEVIKEMREEILHSNEDFEREALDEGIKWEGKYHKLSPEQLAWRRMTIRNELAGDPEKFKQEYPATAEEAFLVSGNAFFDPDALKVYRDHTRPWEVRGNFVDHSGSIILPPNERGYVSIWERPDPNAKYCIGADTASGKQVAATQSDFSNPESERGGRDFSSADVVKITIDNGIVKRKQVAQLHGRMEPDEFAAQLQMLGFFYASQTEEGFIPALVVVERNHMSGETVLKLLQQRHKYPNLYYSRQEGRRFNAPTPVLGWVTSVNTRGPLLDYLSMHIREGAEDIKNGLEPGLEILCEGTLRECLTFVRGEDGKPQAQEGCHDDRVMSLGITLRGAAQLEYVPPAGPMPTVEIGSSPTGWSD